MDKCKVLVLSDPEGITPLALDEECREIERRTPVAFISSTSEDLKEHRARARDAAIRAGFTPRMMEYFRSIALLGRLVDALTAETLGLSVVVAECLQILLKRGLRLQPELEEKFRRYCLSAIERETPLRERCELGLALGHLGDPRVATDLRVYGRQEDHPGYVRIPAGPYCFGKERNPVTIPNDFWLSRYPVTNSQYAVFMEEGGYSRRELWSDEGRKWLEKNKVSEPGLWRDSRWNAPNQPVVRVCYYEAEAFAGWAGGRLPTEEEWEAAARGPDGYEYPWGNNWKDGICNSYEAKLGVTSAVGVFPRSRSKPFGLDDVSGNVWEWCESWYDRDKVGRVVRGGSWNYGAGYCRSSYRYRNHPAYRVNNVGFRLVVLSARTL